ncbi:MAG TPA: radical SAM protein [Acidobacteriota bacterium]|nr:radical SAM protein [Acidobacteriota bacterium]
MFEQGAIRPPNEANSLLVRVTRNCPWNRCHICPPFKGLKFSKRSVEEVKKDIDRMAEFRSTGDDGPESAFLQDADSLVIPTDELLEIIGHIRERFPSVRRITTYARAKTMKGKSVEDLKRLKAAGLARIHSGMESGSANVLALIRKGNTPEDLLAGGMNVVASGISLSEYIMPSVGGRRFSEEHARETANVLNRIRPDFIRVRTLAIHPLSPLQRMADEGIFEPMTDAETVAEIRSLLEQLDEMPAQFRCGDFSLNLLMQVDGRLDRDKRSMIAETDRFLSLDPLKQKAFSLIQRSYSRRVPLDVVDNPEVMKEAGREIERLEAAEPDGFNKAIRALMTRQLPQLPSDCWLE